MKRAAIGWTLVGLACGALFAWIAGNTYWSDEREQGFRSGEALFNPHYALLRFARGLGTRVDEVGLLAALPAHDGVLLLEDWNWRFAPARGLAIRRWVEAGGRLVVTQYEADDKAFAAWAGATGERIRKPKAATTAQGAGAKRGDAESDASEEEDDDEDSPATGSWQHDDRMASEDCLALKLQAGVAPSDPDASLWRLCNAAPGFYWKASRSAQLAIGNRDGPQLLRLGLGRGSVTFLQGQSQFDSCCLLKGDHARLLVIALQLRHGDHLGIMSGNLEMSLLGWLWGEGAPLLLLVSAALLLALWRRMPRFGPLLPEPVRARRSLRAQVAGTATFLAHRGGGEALWQAACRALRASVARTLPEAETADPGRLVAALGHRGFLGTAALERALLRPDLRTQAGLANELATIERARRFVEAHAQLQSSDRGKA
ncbi:MAG: hypothetical protein RL684_2633 [Pseudomonadota bacterium]